MAKAKKAKKIAKIENLDGKGLQEAYDNFVEKINSLIEGYDTLTDVFHLVKELAQDEEVVELAKKVVSDKNSFGIYVLLAAAILRVISGEMQDGDGVFDYNEQDDK